MAEPFVVHSNLELFLTGWYRAAIAASDEEVLDGFEVDNKEPATGTFPSKLLVVRDDGGPSTWFMTGERSVGLSILAGTRQNPKDAQDAARLIAAMTWQIASVDPDNPVTATLSVNGPYPVPEEQDRARQYIPATLAVVATKTTL
ncbi:MAG: hypothetical protein U1E32_05280 [Rhodoglobus sp.]|nr:hypothetical protein [Rhodoglobus sp.]